MVQHEERHNPLGNEVVRPMEASQVVGLWADELKLGPDEFRENLLDSDNLVEGGEKNIEFWLSRAVGTPKEPLKGVVLGKRGMMLTRERLGVSSNLATQAAEKLEKGALFSDLTKGEKVSMAVLTSAKLEVARDIALDVYPALETEFNKRRDELNRLMSDLLVDKKVGMEKLMYKRDLLGEVGQVNVGVAILEATLILNLLVTACGSSAQALGPETQLPGETPATLSTEAPVQVATRTPELATTTATSAVPTREGVLNPNVQAPSPDDVASHAPYYRESRSVIDNINVEHWFSDELLSDPEAILEKKYDFLTSSAFAEGFLYLANRYMPNEGPVLIYRTMINGEEAYVVFYTAMNPDRKVGITGVVFPDLETVREYANTEDYPEYEPVWDEESDTYSIKMRSYSEVFPTD